MTIKILFFLLTFILINLRLNSQIVYYDNQTKLFGIIDKNGNQILKPTYKYMSQFQNGNCLFEQDGKFGLIDETGKVIFPARNKDMCDIVNLKLYEDLYFYYISNYDKELNEYYYTNVGFYDKNGLLKIELMQGSKSLKEIGYSNFCNGIASVSKMKNGNYYYNFINKKGVLVSNIWFDETVIIKNQNYGIKIIDDLKEFYLISENSVSLSDYQIVLNSQYKNLVYLEEMNNCKSELDNCGNCIDSILNKKNKLSIKINKNEITLIEPYTSKRMIDLTSKLNFDASKEGIDSFFVNDVLIISIYERDKYGLSTNERNFIIDEKGKVLKEMKYNPEFIFCEYEESKGLVHRSKYFD